jgi:uncharacterized membrane protein YvbJ
MNFSFLKKMWDAILPVLAPVSVALFVFFGAKYFMNQFRGDREEFTEKLKEIQEIHDREMVKTMASQSAERERHEQNLIRLQKDLNDAVAKHDEKLKELERQKELEFKRLFEKYKNDPAGLAQEMSRVTGIAVYIPEVKK